MTKTDVRLGLAQRQRRFEWELARDAQTRAAGALVAGKTHDLLNLVQIVQLATLELAKRCDDPTAQEFLDDLERAARDAQRGLEEMMAVARPDVAIVRGAPIGAALDAALGAVRDAVAIELRLAAAPEIATRCTREELEQLVIALALDAADGGPIELFVRERAIDGTPWLELVRATAFVPGGDRFDLRTVEAIAQRAGGEVATSERRGGGEELVVALPVIA